MAAGIVPDCQVRNLGCDAHFRIMMCGHLSPGNKTPQKSQKEPLQQVMPRFKKKCLKEDCTLFHLSRVCFVGDGTGIFPLGGNPPGRRHL